MVMAGFSPGLAGAQVRMRRRAIYRGAALDGLPLYPGDGARGQDAAEEIDAIPPGDSSIMSK